MTHYEAKRIADAVHRVLSGNDTTADRTGDGLDAWARSLISAWADRAATAEARLTELRALAQALVDTSAPSVYSQAEAIEAWLVETTAGEHARYLAGLRARLAAYEELGADHDSGCPAAHNEDGVVRACTCAMLVADPDRAERDREACEQIATQIAGAGQVCTRCGCVLERFGGCTKRDGDGFRCGLRGCEVPV